MRPHRRQPTRLPRSWVSLGKNTGMGCHFLLQCIKVKSESRTVVSDSLRPRGLQPTRLLHPWDFPGKSTGVGCHCLLRLGVLHPQYSQLPCMLAGQAGMVWATEKVSGRAAERSGQEPMSSDTWRITFLVKILVLMMTAWKSLQNWTLV